MYMRAHAGRRAHAWPWQDITLASSWKQVVAVDAHTRLMHVCTCAMCAQVPYRVLRRTNARLHVHKQVVIAFMVMASRDPYQVS